MVQFHTLTVTDIRKTIRDAVVVTLEAQDSQAFEFTQGQYLTFRKEFDGEELRRSYSICAGKHDAILQVGIKQVEGGTFSTWANKELSVGDSMEAMAPMGNFYREQPTEDCQHYVGFAAGSGITPILSIMRTTLAENSTARFTLVYANRNVNTVMFRNELEDLKNRNMARVNIIYIFEDDKQDIDLFSGRITAEKCTRLFKYWIDIEGVTCSYICGPEPMMRVVEQSLKDHHQSDENIRFELFASGQPGRAKQPAKTSDQTEIGIPAQVTLGGETRSFLMNRHVSLLAAALDNALDAPYACRAGVCSTCKAKVLEGEVEMVANHALEDYEVEAGYVLTCQCYPVSDTVVWDYDQAGH